MEKMRRGKLNKYRPVVDKFLSRGLTGRDLIALLYERLPEHDEAIARNIRYVSDVNIDDIFSMEEINFLCNNFSEIFSLYYGDDPSNPLFDGETSDLIECIGGMMGIKPGADILIPYHGINFAIHHPNCNHHFLQESDYAQILARNISQPGRSIGYNISQASEDKLEKQIEHLGQFDYIFAFPSTLLIHNSDIQRNIIDLLSLLKAGGTMGLFSVFKLFKWF
jgi:hypothetical protein